MRCQTIRIAIAARSYGLELSNSLVNRRVELTARGDRARPPSGRAMSGVCIAPEGGIIALGRWSAGWGPENVLEQAARSWLPSSVYILFGGEASRCVQEVLVHSRAPSPSCYANGVPRQATKLLRSTSILFEPGSTI